GHVPSVCQTPPSLPAVSDTPLCRHRRLYQFRGEPLSQIVNARRDAAEIDRIGIPQRSSLRPYEGMLSFRSETREAPGSEKPRVHHAAWRRGGRVAPRGARAAAGEAGNYWILGLGHAFSLEPLDRCFCAATARTRLDRGSQCRDRVSVGGGTFRTLRRDRGRV